MRRRGRLRLLVANHKSTLVDYVVEAGEAEGGALEVAVVPLVEWDLTSVCGERQGVRACQRCSISMKCLISSAIGSDVVEKG